MECAVMLSRDYVGVAAGRETPQYGQRSSKKKALSTLGDGNKLPAAGDEIAKQNPNRD